MTSAHDALVELIDKTLHKKARVAGIKIKTVREGVIDVIKKGTPIVINPDLIMQIKQAYPGTLFIFEIKTGTKESKSIKQLNMYKSFLIQSRTLLEIRNVLSFTEIRIFWISEKENKVVNVEHNTEISLFPDFINDPFQFLVT